MKNKENKKEPRTIKLSTLIITVCYIIVALGSFVGGMIYEHNYNDNVHAEAVKLEKSLK